MKYGKNAHNIYTLPVLRDASHRLQKTTKPPSAKTNGGFLLPAVLVAKMLQ